MMDKEQELRPQAVVAAQRAYAEASNAGHEYRLQRAIAAYLASPDEQAEVVGWVSSGTLAALRDPGVNVSFHIQRERIDGWFDRPLYASPPAVAAGGVTEAQIKRAVDAALGEPENARRAADPDHPEADYAAGRVDAAQCVRDALTSVLAVGDDGIREEAMDATDLSILDSFSRTLTDWADDLSAPYVLRSELHRFLTWFPSIRGRLTNAALPTPPSRGEGE